MLEVKHFIMCEDVSLSQIPLFYHQYTITDTKYTSS